MVSTKKTDAGLTSRDEMRRRARQALDSITPEEDAALTAAAESDADNPPLSEDTLSSLRRRGRPPLDHPKLAVKLRLDREIVAHFKALGPGWQTRINDTLRQVAKLK